MKIDTIQTSFVGGEFAPSLFGRTDTAQYGNALATLENMLIRSAGSVISCPGTEFINECKTGDPHPLSGCFNSRSHGPTPISSKWALGISVSTLRVRCCAQPAPRLMKFPTHILPRRSRNWITGRSMTSFTSPIKTRRSPRSRDMDPSTGSLRT